ncbi:WecB/TagA/CpsF family glycosyltransferase [Caenimonas sp. SL110]|uniref:WecB/TagA/CpsF family glycosyltransferase n=1 Tax=Caenimonas sp. SL110 TaxID=1450524 RepID=UPI0006528D98|nr:WecB/TagA/CpsF family glycosyltransferase [Caenimonas sp. SL110]
MSAAASGSAPEVGGWQPRWRSLAQGVLRVNSDQGEQQLLDTLTQPSEPLMVAFVNAHAMNSVAHDPRFYRALMEADIVLRDGIGMDILFRLLKQVPGLNLNGTDLIPKIIRRYAGRPIALFGTQEPYLARAAGRVTGELAPGGECITAHGFLETADYLRLAAAHKSELIVLGMGMPRQEEVAVMLRAALDHPCLIVCGGAIIDFLGGKTTRAPRWVRGMHLEWAWRLALEPKRLFRRYVMGNPLFLARAFTLAATSSRADRTSS